MRRFAVLAIVLSLSSVACVRHYQPPTPDEPHAVLKVRRTYERLAGTDLRETIEIDRHQAYDRASPAAAAGAGRMDAMLVHPTPAVTRVGSQFYHWEMRVVQESYTEQVPHYETESYDCSTGFGTNVQHRTCTRSVTRYRTETKYRWVDKQVEIPDGSCSAALAFAPVVGHVYLVQYTYQGHGACYLSCFEQVPLGNGTFQNQPCPPPPPAPP